MAGGRPPSPIEHHRRVGRGGDKKADGRPITGELVPLPMADGPPPLPVEIEEYGQGAALWARIWHQAITWISPHSDMAAVIEACMLADDLQRAREEWRAFPLNDKMARVMVSLSKEYTAALSALGFNPTARAKLGVAEVKKMTGLQQLLERQQG